MLSNINCFWNCRLIFKEIMEAHNTGRKHKKLRQQCVPFQRGAFRDEMKMLVHVEYSWSIEYRNYFTCELLTNSMTLQMRGREIKRARERESLSELRENDRRPAVAWWQLSTARATGLQNSGGIGKHPAFRGPFTTGSFKQFLPTSTKCEPPQSDTRLSFHVSSQHHTPRAFGLYNSFHFIRLDHSDFS